MLKRLILIIILSNSLMFDPGALLTLAFKKMLHDNSHKIGNSVSPAPALCTMAKRKKAPQRVVFVVWIDILDLFCKFKHKKFLTS